MQCYAKITCLLLAFSYAPRLRAQTIDFVRDVRPIFQKHCYECHGDKKQKSGLRLDVKQAAFRGGDGYGECFLPGKSADSPLIRLVTSKDKEDRMPPEGDALNTKEIQTLIQWIDEGALWPDGVDVALLKNIRDHWSFKPIAAPEGIHTIDSFIQKQLEMNGLAMSPEADRVSWLRRVTFDLTGLPPTPEETQAFVGDTESGAFERAVDVLLQSPRYGERWAQFWLDIVRYADTHGFEVNTERPNAWPYRDYVIRAFNEDKPYDRFIQEQIAGDHWGEDAATGFLVTASVLLSGQIGKDAPSIRLARQDSIDEIVNNIGQTFLGLSIGCARCHDHKFDPISAMDYYSMQAFVSGVEYEDRELRTPAAEALKQTATPMRVRVAEIDEQLNSFVSVARPNTKSTATSASKNIETFPSVEAKWIRFSIHDSSVHPSLGLIEPCIDEFEIFTDEPQPRNIALAVHGTKVTVSGSNISTNHKPEHLNDGVYGNASSWMSDAKGSGWLMLELPEATRIGRVVWSRDRKEQFDDRLATVFTLEAGTTEQDLSVLSQVLPRRPSVSPRKNTDRFLAVTAKRLRFTIQATNGLEPCLDELEVYNAQGQNVALSSFGTRVKTSGDTNVADRHEPRFVHDGLVGNSQSWLSNESGKGWVELEFPSEQEVSRVVWSRDREGKFEDRLATEYKIDIATGTEALWQLVADSTDRFPWIAGTDRGRNFTTVGLSREDAATATRLLDEKRDLEAKIKTAENGQKVFAGTFRKPDKIHLLSRGDPEQPREEVIPAVLRALGDVALNKDSAEQERRLVLANWIASPENPLTARVMVNRIWQGHFGVGIVPTPSDFGNNGMQPSHPELLDWLSTEFIRTGWSMKAMHRLIVLSRTYRQSSAVNPLGAEKDADVRLLWRYPSRRIDAETIRDSMLAISGQLNLKMFGRGYDLFDKRGGLSGYKPIESFRGEGLRRMIYAHKVRRETEAIFGAFDCPDAGQSTAIRRESTTPIQALNLFNSVFTLEQSQALAKRLKREAGDDLENQIQHAYRLALSREPSIDELQEAESVVREFGLETFGRALFNCNEALFLP